MKLRILDLKQAFHDQDLYSIAELESWMYHKSCFTRYAFILIINNGFIAIDANNFNKEELRADIEKEWNNALGRIDTMKKVVN